MCLRFLKGNDDNTSIKCTEVIMKVGEARRIYSEQLNTLREQQQKIRMEQKNSGGKDNNGVIFEYSDEIQKSIDETQAFMEKLMAYSALVHNSEVAKQQGEAMEEYADDVAKCMEIARRLSRGDKVPASDEKKLMEYNMKIYMTAKNMGMMNMNKDRKEYDSLWEDEEEDCSDKNQPSPSETADNAEVRMDMPEITKFDV